VARLAATQQIGVALLGRCTIP